MVSRRPDAVLTPQFWAEDGLTWYGDAYAEGLRSLLHPDAGYLQSLPRFIALAVQPLPLLWAPAIFNSVAITIQVLPAVILVSPRFRRQNLAGRALLALLYLSLPNSWEVHANLTNAQWHLALLACELTLAETGGTVGWVIFDLTVLASASLTGPFCLVLAPIAGGIWWRKREPERLVTVPILAAGTIIQGVVLLATLRRDRSHMDLGATPALLMKLLSRHVFLGATEGMKHPLARFTDENVLLATLVVLTGTSVLIWTARAGSLELRSFLVFGFTLLAAALISPQVSRNEPQWEVLLRDDGARYWLFPMLAFMAGLIRLLDAPARRLRWAAAAVLLACAPGIVRDWRMPPYEDFGFSAHARAFSRAPSGTTVVIPINPPGRILLLVKH